MAQQQHQQRPRGRADLRSIDGGHAGPAPDVSGRVPPHNLDAEGAVISAVLLGHSTNGRPGLHRGEVESVIDMLEPEAFYSDANGRIWDAIRTVSAAQKPVDIVTVAAYLQDRGRLAQIGGGEYLATLADATPAVAHIRAHAEIVERKWRLRQAIAKAQRIAAEGYGDVGDEDDFVQAAATELTELNNKRAAASEATMIDAAVDTAAAHVNALARGVSFGLLTGYTEIDRLTGGLKAPEVTLVGAPPKTGKTTLARAITTNITRTREVRDGRSIGRGVVWVSLEMRPEQQALAWGSTIGRVDLKRVERGEATANELEDLRRGMAWLKALPIAIFGRRSIRVGEITRLMREAKAELARKGAEPRLLVIDHLQLLFKNEPKDERRNEASVYGDITRALGDIAEAENLPVMLITQLTEDDKGRMKARGSRDIEADAHNFWILEVDNDKVAPTFPANRSTSPVEAKIDVKFQRSGPKGSTTLWFTPAYTDFSETVWNERNGGGYE